jgi:ribonuclease P protein component
VPSSDRSSRPLRSNRRSDGRPQGRIRRHGRMTAPRPGRRRRSRLCTRCLDGRNELGEAHLPTKQAKAREDARVPCPHVHARRPRRAQGTPAEGPAPPGALTVGPRRTATISSRRTFEALGASGRRGGSGPVRLRYLADQAGDEVCRVAYAIPRRTGGAVVRNRLRRRLRAAVDQVAGELAPGAYLISPDATAINMDFNELTECLRRSITAAGARREDTR